jgi:hypothetical protein
VKLSLAVFTAVLSVAAAGCFYPPTVQPPPQRITRTIVPLPYDLTWTAVNDVIRQNGYRVVAQNPNHGIIEVQGRSFSLQDADCGQIKGVVGTYAATPENDASAVFNFHVTAVSNEKSAVEVQAAFASPLKVPLRPTQNEECVSRGTQESRLLQQILAQATVTKPPVYKTSQQASAPAPQSALPLLTGRPTLLKPDFLKLKKPN